jgi:hypothetical protein
LEWSYPAQLKRYQDFARERKIPVYIVIGLELEFLKDDDEFDDFGDDTELEQFMFNIPLEEAKYPALYESVFAKFERPYDRMFFWKNGKLS